MGGSDTTIGIPRKLRDELSSKKIIPDETYPSLLKRLLVDHEKLKSIRRTLAVADSPEKKIEGIKNILEE